MDNAAETEPTDDEWTEYGNKEDCEEIRKLIAGQLIEKTLGFVEKGPDNEDIDLAPARSIEMFNRLWSITDILDKDGPVSIIDKSRISSDLCCVLYNLSSVIFQFPNIMDHLKRMQGRERAAKARKGHQDLSPRNEEIFRLAKAKLDGRKRLPGPWTMAGIILDDVNEWIEREGTYSPMKQDAVKKVLEADPGNWKAI